MYDEKDEEKQRGHQTGKRGSGEELQPVQREHVGGQFTALDQRGCGTFNGAEHHQVGLVALEGKEGCLGILCHREAGPVDERFLVEPVGLSVTNHKQVAVAGVVQIRDANRRHAADQTVEVHAVLNGVGILSVHAAVPFHAGDGPRGFTEQDETLIAGVGLRFRRLNGLTQERRPADVNRGERAVAGRNVLGEVGRVVQTAEAQTKRGRGGLKQHTGRLGRSGQRPLVGVQQVALHHAIAGQETGDAPACFLRQNTRALIEGTVANQFVKGVGEVDGVLGRHRNGATAEHVVEGNGFPVVPGVAGEAFHQFAGIDVHRPSVGAGGEGEVLGRRGHAHR